MITHDGYSHTDNHSWLTRLQIHVLHPNITLCGGVYMWGNGSQTATSSLFLSPSGFPGILSLALRVPCQLTPGIHQSLPPQHWDVHPCAQFLCRVWVSTANTQQAPHTPSYIRALHLVSLQSLLSSWKTSCIPKGHFETFTAC